MSDVPHLRFPEFTGEWKKYRLDEMGESFIGLTYSPKDVVENEGTIVFRSSNIQNGQIDYSDIVRVSKTIKERIITRENDLLICARNGSPRLIGKNALIKKTDANNTFGAFMMVYRSIDNDFIHPLLSTRRYVSQVGENLGARINQITTSDLNSFEFFFPKNDGEKRKIGKLFDLLNERIATQNKIIEDLKKLKSAIIDKSFCYPNEFSPQKRFTGFIEEWQLVYLSDICQRVRTKNLNSQCTLVLTIAAQFGLVSQEEFFNKSVASDNLEGYYLIQKGDFAYNKSYSCDYAWGAVKRLECFSEGVLSPLYICFRPDTTRIDSDFLAHYFESKKWYKGIADIAGEGARNHGLLNLSVIDYFKTRHRLPSLKEQKVIANVLNKLTSKISIEKKLYDDLLLQRQYLLQQMFI